MKYVSAVELEIPKAARATAFKSPAQAKGSRRPRSKLEVSKRMQASLEHGVQPAKEAQSAKESKLRTCQHQSMTPKKGAEE
eukprot:492316-Rhodomonas_salina.1